MKQDFYFAKKQNESEVFTIYYSSTKDTIISDKVKKKEEIEILGPVPEKITNSVLRGELQLLNMKKLLERMRDDI